MDLNLHKNSISRLDLQLEKGYKVKIHCSL